MAKKSFENILKDLKSRIVKFSNSFTSSIRSYKGGLIELSELIAKIEESWSGSWIGFHARLYYRGYKKPKWDESFDSEWGSLHGISESWEEKNYDDISSFINKTYKGKNILEIEDFLKRELEKAKELQLKLSTELSLIRDSKNFSNEIEIFKKIETKKWGISVADFIKYKTPRQVWTRDSFAMSQGIKTPPHIEYQARVLSSLATISDIEDFIKISQRLIRQIEIRENVKRRGTAVLNSISKVLCVCKRFHVVARQLRKRYNNRPTLEIDDEYDVQDLLHALLRVYFDDVRPEEWTPSYAGGSSKIDLLLKDQKTVVEVKKTRKNLADKEVGEQLLIDIAKYKQHPDCKTLICFIYDPEGKIGNPKGLENDLNQRSNDDINIITVIEPS